MRKADVIEYWNTCPITRSSARIPSSASSTSPMFTFFLHAFFPFLLACLNWDGAPSVECGFFLAVIKAVTTTVNAYVPSKKDIFGSYCHSASRSDNITNLPMVISNDDRDVTTTTVSPRYVKYVALLATAHYEFRAIVSRLPVMERHAAGITDAD